MRDLPNQNRPAIGILAASAYIAIMAAGMVYISSQGIRYGDVAMLDGFWMTLVGLNVMTLWVAARYFGWQAVGFGMPRLRPLLWLLPFLAVCRQGHCGSAPGQSGRTRGDSFAIDR